MAVGSGEGRWRPAPDDLLVAAWFVLVRAIYLGPLRVRMDLQFLRIGPQVPDLGLLQHRLAETIFYEHTQPPLYPLLLGILLKVSPFPDAITLQVAALAMGLALALVLRRLFGTLRLERAATLGAVALVVAYPGLVAIEQVASYDLPTTLALAVFALVAVRYVRSGRVNDLALTAGAAAVPVLLRSIFHPLWYVLVLALVLAIRRPRAAWRRTALALGLPALVIVAVMAKNAYLYDQFTLTTWQGSSLDKIAGAAAGPEDRARLQADGTVSELFGRGVFRGYDTYADALPPCVRQRPDIPILAEPTKPSTGWPNLNDECQLAVYRKQSADAWAFIRHRPGKFVGAQLAGFQMFFEPPLPIVFTTNESALRGPTSLFRWTILPSFSLPPFAHTEFGVLRAQAYGGGLDLEPTAIALDVGAVVLAVLAWRRLRRGAKRPSDAAWVLVGFLCAWTTLIGSITEINENARYRLLIQPYLFAVLAFAVERAVCEVQARR